MHTSPDLTLPHGLVFADLYRREGLVRVDEVFLAELAAADAGLAARYQAARANPTGLAVKDESALMLAVAPHLDAFLAHLFGIEAEWEAEIAAHRALDPLYAAKRLFVQRRAVKAYPAAVAAGFDGAALLAGVEAALGGGFAELKFARAALGAMAEAEAVKAAGVAGVEAAAEPLDTYLRFAAWAVATQHFGQESILFTTPKKLDFAHLVETEGRARVCETFETSSLVWGGADRLSAHTLAHESARRVREGFALTDARGSLAKALDEANYCIYCHHQGRDSCSKGFREGVASRKSPVASQGEEGTGGSAPPPSSLATGDWRLATAPEAQRLATAPEAFGLATAPEALGLATAPEALGLATAPEALGLATAPEALGLATAPEALAKFKTNPLGIPLNGCPLEEHISEMHELKAQAVPLGALAMVVVANPMCAGTGHRICNDCMKACVYQKQEPVNIPLAETRVLDDVLKLPWGFEIYSLLTRWNPLNLRRPLPLAATGRKVLVVGLGPAGYTLAHHLMNDGHDVVGIEGLKLEPLGERLVASCKSQVARKEEGNTISSALAAPSLATCDLRLATEFRPIRDVRTLWQSLETRPGSGFGGVAEYGITVRWDKNFLTLLRLLLERRAECTLIGGVRFGSSITPEQAWGMGFDHIALCMGAGSPTLIEMENGLARGVRTASDFLMNLQLSGAGRMDSLANLQVRLPIAVIGGGLTAVDTTTEALAYYPVQVEKFLARYEVLVAALGEAAVEARWSVEDREVAEEFIAHARAIRAEKAAARAAGRAADIHALLDGWGGATLIYRKRLIDAPSYRLNHEEVEKALEEGIFFAELWEPQGVVLDEHGAAKGLRLRRARGASVPSAVIPGLSRDAGDGENKGATAPYCAGSRNESGMTEGERILPARTILMAAGTSPNTVLAREHPESATLHGHYFQAVDENGRPVTPARNAKPDVPRVLMHVREDGRAMSFFGDLHPSFAGNVVKAMGSAKQGYPVVSAMLGRLPACHPGLVPGSGAIPRGSALESTISRIPAQGRDDSDLRERLSARVHAVERLTPTIVEVVLHAPLAAENFKPGQFYRLQNFEALARKVVASHTLPEAAVPSRQSPVAREKSGGEDTATSPSFLATGDWRLATTLAMEPLAMTGAWVDRARGLVSVIALEMGGSSDLCAQLLPGEPVVLMGPTGTPTHIPENTTLLLVGGGLGNAVLFSIGQAARAAGTKVLYFAGYKALRDRYKVGQIEAAADVIVWCCDEAPGFAPTRAQDRTFVGNIVEAMRAYGEEVASRKSPVAREEEENESSSILPPFLATCDWRLATAPAVQRLATIPLSDCTHAVVIGSDRMMAAVAAARHGVLKPYMRAGHKAVGSINSPMQCMMKEICGACLQRQVDAATGEVKYVYSCFDQDQDLDAVDFRFLNARLRQNSLSEKLTASWLDWLLAEEELRERRAG